MDVDVFVTAHQGEWRRLEALTARSGRLTGAEADELVALYQRTATHLSTIRSATPDPVLLARLSALVANARHAVVGSHTFGWRDLGRFFTEVLPATFYLAWRWWVPVGVLFCLVSAVMGWWVASDSEVRAAIGTPELIREMTREGGAYEAYYSSHPAAAFASQVWTNNARVAALTLLSGVLLGIPVVPLLWTNAENLGVGLGLMTSAGRLDVFLGLVVPHGLLELTAIFVAAGAGLRLGWTVIDPGPRRRLDALAQEGRAAAATAAGLTVVLLVAGAIEGFVTPSQLPTWARIAIGVLAEALFLAYVFGLGRRAVRAGETGDVSAELAGDRLPTAG